MKRLAVLIASLITTSGVTFGPSNPIAIAHVSGMYARTVPLESVPILSNNGVAPLSPDNPGHYQTNPITHALKFSTKQRILLQLGKKFDALSGTLYNDDDSGYGGMLVSSDATNPNDVKVISRIFSEVKTEKVIMVQVRGIGILEIDVVNGDKFLSLGYYDLVANLTPTVVPSSTPVKLRQVIPRYPTGNAAVAAESEVPFAWQPFPGTANYAFHIWMVSQSGSATITGSTPLTFAATIHDKTSYIWDDHSFLPGTYQYALLPLDAKGKALARWSAPTQITVAS